MSKRKPTFIEELHPPPLKALVLRQWRSIHEVMNVCGRDREGVLKALMKHVRRGIVQVKIYDSPSYGFLPMFRLAPRKANAAQTGGRPAGKGVSLDS